MTSDLEMATRIKRIGWSRLSACLLMALALLMLAAPVWAQLADGRYHLVSRHSDLLLTVAGSSSENGATLIQAPRHGTGSQQFDLRRQADGSYVLLAVHSGKALDLFSGSEEPGAQVGQWSEHRRSNQRWLIEPSGAGYFQLRSMASGQALDVWDRSREPGAQVRQWPATGYANQQWRLERVEAVELSSYDAEVWRQNGRWYAHNAGRIVYDGTHMLDAIQASLDSLTPGRRRKESVVVWHSGSVGPHQWDGDVKAVDLPSFSILDVRGTIHVADSGDDLVVPIRARRAESIEIRNLRIEGNPRYGVWIQSSRDVHLHNVSMALWETRSVGLGIRIDAGAGQRSQNVRIDRVEIEGSRHHAVETFGVDDLVIGDVITRDTGGSGLLLNDTRYAYVQRVDATRPNVGGGYAGLRLANNAGPEIRVEQVKVRGGARGVFCVSGSHGITVQNVDVQGTDAHGVLIQDCQDVAINGGLIRNNNNEAVRIASRSGNQHQPASRITLQNLRVVDDRANRRQTYGIRETAGGGTNNNRIINNDLREAGIRGDLVSEAPGTVLSGNLR